MLLRDSGATLAMGREPEGLANFASRPPFADASEQDGTSGESGSPRNGLAAAVLVIDDEIEIAELLAEMVDDLGYRTITTRSGDEARAIVREIGRAFDAIVANIPMPSDDGPRFYEWLLQLYPDLAPRTGFIAGPLPDAASLEFLARVKCRVLQRPFSETELAWFLEHLVAAARGADSPLN